MGPKAILIAAVLALGGCAHTGVVSPSMSPTCTALIGPLKYNTYVKTSRRYAGRDLAADIHQRNQVGQFLGCPAFR